MAHILFSIDRPGWCFDHIAQAVQQRLSQYHTFKTMPWAKITKETCDVLVALCWERSLYSFGNTKCKALVTCIYDHLSWNINETSLAHFKLTLRNSSAVGVCNMAMLEHMKELIPANELPPIFLLEDGVDTELFTERPLPQTFCCGWTGNSARSTPGGPDDYKGLAILRQACDLAGVELRILDSAGGGLWPHKRMPQFYEQVSVQLIGSALEGTPNPLLEAMACARPVLTTPVGLAPQLIENGKNGFIVDRNVQAFADKIRQLATGPQADLQQIGRRARNTVVQAYSWNQKAQPWKKCLDFALLGHEVCRSQGVVEVAVPQQPIQVAPAVEVQRPSTPPPKPPRPKPEGKPRVLLISDVRGWAFHQNMLDLELYLSGKFSFEHWFIEDWITHGSIPDMERYDVVFCVYHRWGIDKFLPWDRTVGSLRALWFKPENRQPPQPDDIELVNSYRAFHVVTQQNLDELEDCCPNVMYLTNPVNTDRFPKSCHPFYKLVFSWNGNAKHASGGNPDVKGFHTIIHPVMRKLNVPFNYAEYNSCRLEPAEMPEFYAKSNVAICMSEYEGASNSIMEALAAGHIVISTAVGNILEIRQSQIERDGLTGVIIVPRTIDGLMKAIQQLQMCKRETLEKMSKVNRKEIRRNWSWHEWADRYAEFLRKAING